jgi:hypothetical protein
MKEFLQVHGDAVLSIMCVTIIASVLLICITAGTMNSNKHYYASMNKCIEVEGTWIPNKNTGICLARGKLLND